MQLFGFKEYTQKEKDQQVKQWIRELKREERTMERAVKKAEKEMKSLERELKKEAKNKGTTPNALKAYAKAIVAQKKHRNQLLLSKTQIHSGRLQIQDMAGQMKMAGIFKNHAQMTQMMNNLCNINQIQDTAYKMQQEMMRMEVIQETMDEVIDDINPISDEEVEDQVDKVVMELTGMQLSQIGEIEGTTVIQPEIEEDVEEDDELTKRMAALN